jgi:hypothetical protein
LGEKAGLENSNRQKKKNQCDWGDNRMNLFSSKMSPEGGQHDRKGCQIVIMRKDE